MGSGPSNAEARVLLAMAAPPVAHDDPALEVLLEDVAALQRAVFQTTNAASLAIGGASRAGLEAALASVLEPGDRVLVGAYGHFGELLCTLAARHGAQVERVDAEWGMPVDVNAMVKRIRDRPPKLVAIVHADTSTGVLQPLEAIGAACREVDALLLADLVLSIGGCEVSVDRWAVDIAVGGLQKCLGGPPGLALVTYSVRAQLAMRIRPDSNYLDLKHLEAVWKHRHASESTELPVTMLLAAREALRLVLDEGLEQRWDRHRRASQALRAGLAEAGLEFFGDLSCPMITLVKVPDGVNEAAVRAQLLTEHGIEIMAAFGPLRGRVWRIGTMGTNACLPSVRALLAGLRAVLSHRPL